MQVFRFDDYKEFIRAIIASKKVRGYQSQLAVAANCQRAFISQVLNSDVHLTLDHASGLCHFWNISDLETDYFMELVSLARAGTESMKRQCRRRLKALTKQNTDLGKLFSGSIASEGVIHSNYYSSWHWSAIHILTSMAQFQSAEAIANRLGLPKKTVENILSGLSKIGLIKLGQKGNWVPTEKEVFLKRDSPMNFTHHWNWRQKGLEDIQLGGSDSVHYSALHALSRKDIEIFKSNLFDFISTSRALVAPSSEEELLCFTCDLFQP